MILQIADRIKTGSIKKVYTFGSVPSIPGGIYDVVKLEENVNGYGIRVFSHFPRGQHEYKKDGVIYSPLSDHVLIELPALLDFYSFVDNHGETMTVRDTHKFTGIVPINDDDTLSMDRLFYIAALPY